MQLKKNDLIDLVNSLSASEKKGLTLFLNTLPKGKNISYPKLFELVYKEKRFPALNAHSLQTQAKTKKRLYDNLLKGLRSYHDKKSSDIIVQNMLCEMEILYDLSLPEQAMHTMHKAYDEAKKFEKYGLMLQLFEWERKLNIVLDTVSRPNEDIEHEEQEVLGKLNEALVFKRVFSEVKAVKKQYGYVKNLPEEQLKLQNLLSSLPDITKDSAQKGRFYYYLIHTLYCWMTFNHSEAYAYSKNLLSEKMEAVLSNEFLEGLLEHITSCICLAKFEEAHSTMASVERFIIKQKYDQSSSFMIRAFYFRITYKTMIHYYMGNLKELDSAVQEAEQKLHYFRKQISVEMRQVIQSNLKVAYMVVGQIDKAEQIIAETLKLGPKLVRKDLYDDLVLFNLFILLHTKNYVLIPSAALSAHRYFKRFASAGDVDLESIDAHYKISGLLIKDHNYEDPEVAASVLTKIKDILSAWLTTTTGLNNFQEARTYYVIWIDSMLSRQPFHEVAESWYQQHKKQNHF